MNRLLDDLKPVSPKKVLQEIVAAIPEDCRGNMIIIGSLAVGYQYFSDRDDMYVRTKDADCLLSPRVEAVPKGIAVTEKLFKKKWVFRKDDEWSAPGTADTPDEELPAVRLRPPGDTDWFIELLTVPESSADRDQHWSRLETSHGHFGICSFGYLSLATYEPIMTDLAINIATPEMMALANLLEHPEIRPQLISGGFAGRTDIRRSNKDLGRVLAIATLAEGRKEDVLLSWPDSWLSALKVLFPDELQELAARAGSGIRALLESDQDLEQAHHTVAYGLLASNPPTVEQLRIIGQRLLQDAIIPLEHKTY